MISVRSEIRVRSIRSKLVLDIVRSNEAGVGRGTLEPGKSRLWL